MKLEWLPWVFDIRCPDQGCQWRRRVSVGEVVGFVGIVVGVGMVLSLSLPGLRTLRLDEVGVVGVVGIPSLLLSLSGSGLATTSNSR